MDGTRISFDQFGRNFIDLVIDARTLAAEINRTMAGQVVEGEGQIWGEILTESHRAVLGTATVMPASDHAFVVNLPLELVLTLDLAVEGEVYEIGASVQFTLTPEAYAPLIIYLATTPITSDAVTVGAIVKRSGLGVARSFIPDRLATQLVAMVNERLTASEPQRRIDVLARVQQSLAT